MWGVNVSDARRVLRTHEESWWRGVAGVEAAFETRDANAFVFFLSVAASLKLAMALDAAVVVFYISQICSGLDVVASRCVRKEKTSNNNFLNLKKKVHRS